MMPRSSTWREICGTWQRCVCGRGVWAAVVVVYLCMTLAACVAQLDEDLAQSLRPLVAIVQEIRRIEADPELSQDQRASAIAALRVDGATLEDLCLSFELPGHEDIALWPPAQAVANDAGAGAGAGSNADSGATKTGDAGVASDAVAVDGDVAGEPGSNPGAGAGKTGDAGVASGDVVGTVGNVDGDVAGEPPMVTLDNVEAFVVAVLTETLHTALKGPAAAFRRGFGTVCNARCLLLFTAEELRGEVCGGEAGVPAWTPQEVTAAIKCDHGYTMSSRAVTLLVDAMCSFTPRERRDFVQFATGSVRLPPGGLASLKPALTVVMKYVNDGDNPDAYLPSASTCTNYLKLPDYSSAAVLRRQLGYAVREGRSSFLLS